MVKKLSCVLLVVTMLAAMCCIAAITTNAAVATNTVYFQVPSSWGTGYKQIYCHVWANGGDPYALWQSKKEKATKVSTGLWSYVMPSDSKYNVVIFSDDIGSQTYNLSYGPYCLLDNDTVYVTGKKIENPEDSTKTADEAKWKLHTEYGPLKQMTSISNIVGDTDLTKVKPVPMAGHPSGKYLSGTSSKSSTTSKSTTTGSTTTTSDGSATTGQGTEQIIILATILVAAAGVLFLTTKKAKN
ncbi:MAG: hypothetical protein Q8876_02375 [Bacillota bacterium]|nr:hypothetical protein [Bacillota bacterium]